MRSPTKRPRDPERFLPWRAWLSMLVGLAAAVWFGMTISFAVRCDGEYALGAGGLGSGGFRCPEPSADTWNRAIAFGIICAIAAFLVMTVLIMRVNQIRGRRA